MKTKTGNYLAEVSRTIKRDELDHNKLRELAAVGMNQQQCADYFGLGRQYIESNQDVLDTWREGRREFELVIIQGQYEIATDRTHRGRDRMLQYLGKVQLGQREIQQIESESIGTFDNILKMLNSDQSDDDQLN